MNNGTIFVNFSSRIQKLKPSPKWLLSFCLIFSLSFSSNFLLAQPNTFTISGCSNLAANGNYTRDAADVGGCPCYNSSNGGVVYRFSAFGWWVYNPTGPCSLPSGSAQGIYTAASCDILTATFLQCDPATTLNFSAPASIPTLSEWGLIVLTLMFMTLGTVYLLQPNWKGNRQ